MERHINNKLDYKMNKNRIEINIELSTGQKVKLQLSPRNYKQNYRDFKEKYKINEEEGIKLKNIIQNTLMQLARNRLVQKYATPIKQQLHQEEQHQDSPRFPKYVNDQESQTIQVIENVNFKQINKSIDEKEMSRETEQTLQVLKKQKKEKVQAKYYQSGNDQILEKQFTKHFLSKNGSEDDREPQPKTPPKKIEKKEQHKEHQLPTGIPYHFQKSYGNKVQKSQIKSNKINKKDNFKSPPKSKKSSTDRDTVKLNRLYYQHTDSFKSKKNEQVDPKQMQDFIEVQKYDLNNRLKRTTRDFFNQLSKRTTQSWDSKTAKSTEKHFSQEETLAQQKIGSTKKVSLEKAYKGSHWCSKSRCEAQLYIRKIQKEKAEMIIKDQSIRKRLKEKKMKTLSQQKSKQKSRSCQKCNPKFKDNYLKPVKKVMKQVHPKDKKKYISNILRQAYQQRCEQVRKAMFD